MTKTKKIILGILFLALGALAVWYFASQGISAHAIRTRFNVFIGRFGIWGGIVYMILYAVNTVTMIPPIAFISFIAGFLFGKVWGAVYLLGGALLGTSAAFFIARTLGRNVIKKILRGRGRKLDAILRRRGFATVFFLRLIPVVPYEMLNYFSGLSAMKFRHYFTATLLGSVPWVVAIVYFGDKASGIEKARDLLAPEFLIAAGVVLLIAAVPFLYKLFKKMNMKKKKKPVDVIIFDLDGTLVDSRRDIVESVNYTLRETGRKEKSFQEIVAYIGTGAHDLIRQALNDANDPEIDRALGVFTEYFQAHAYDHTRLYRGVKETLEYFRNKTLLIVTNRRRDLTEDTLGAMGIAPYFKDIIGGDDEHCLKPSGCPINRILNSLPHSKDRCLMVGDMNLDVSAGKDAGILTCAVTYGVGGQDEIFLAEPDYVIDTIEELKIVIK